MKLQFVKTLPLSNRSEIPILRMDYYFSVSTTISVTVEFRNYMQSNWEKSSDESSDAGELINSSSKNL